MSRVRVILEGEKEMRGGQIFAVAAVQPDGGHFAYLIDPSLSHVVSVEDIPDPEIAWKTGDVATCRHGHVYMRTGSGKWYSPRAEDTDLAFCTGFKPLLIGGKPVQ